MEVGRSNQEHKGSAISKAEFTNKKKLFAHFLLLLPSITQNGTLDKSKQQFTTLNSLLNVTACAK